MAATLQRIFSGVIMFVIITKIITKIIVPRNCFVIISARVISFGKFRAQKGGGPENAKRGAKRSFPPGGVHIVLQIPPSKRPNPEEIVSRGGHLK